MNLEKCDYSFGETRLEMSFRFVNHTADVQFIASASTKNILFQECVRAWTHYVTGGKKLAGTEKKKILLKGKDDSAKLYSLLDELIYLLDSEGFLTTRATLAVQGAYVKGTLHGIRVKDEGFRHVKAATYADMYIRKRNSTWKAQAVLDV